MKRKLFEELSEGFEALKDEREGKVTLKQHPVKMVSAAHVTSGELASLRERLHLSQAAILIKMVEKYPDTIDRLNAV